MPRNLAFSNSFRRIMWQTTSTRALSSAAVHPRERKSQHPCEQGAVRSSPSGHASCCASLRTASAYPPPLRLASMQLRDPRRMRNPTMNVQGNALAT